MKNQKKARLKSKKNQLTINNPFEITNRLKYSKQTNYQLNFSQLIIRNENKISTINRIY